MENDSINIAARTDRRAQAAWPAWAQATASVLRLPDDALLRDNLAMDATAPLSKSARIRRWLRGHSVAIAATAVVLGVLAWKNQYQFWNFAGGLGEIRIGGYGWPQACIAREDQLSMPGATLSFKPAELRIWPSLVLDAAVALSWLVATWVVFSRTQRRCQRPWQLSLASLLAAMLLAAVICGALRMDSSNAIWQLPPIDTDDARDAK